VSSQIDQKSTKKIDQQIDQKSTNNRPKIDQNPGLEGVWADSGSQARLGKHLGWPRCDFRGQDDPNLAPKMEPKSKKSMQESIKIFVPRGVGFWNVFGESGEAKWSQVGTKNASKIDLNFGRPILQKKIVKIEF